MGPQTQAPGAMISARPDLKERLMSGSGSPGRLGPDNVSGDSGIGCLKVSVTVPGWLSHQRVQRNNLSGLVLKYLV